MAPGFRRAGPSSPSWGGICPDMETWFCGSGGGGFPGPKPRDDEPGGPWASFCPNRVENISVISTANNTFKWKEKAGFFSRMTRCFSVELPPPTSPTVYSTLYFFVALLSWPPTVIPDIYTHITTMTAACWSTRIYSRSQSNSYFQDFKFIVRQTGTVKEINMYSEVSWCICRSYNLKITHQRHQQGREKMPAFQTLWPMPKSDRKKNTTKNCYHSRQTSILYFYLCYRASLSSDPQTQLSDSGLLQTIPMQYHF